MKTKNVLEWLSEENQPSARYHALTELLGKVESGSFPFVGFGLISQFPIELVLLADTALALPLSNLRRNTRSRRIRAKRWGRRRPNRLISSHPRRKWKPASTEGLTVQLVTCESGER